VCWQGTRGGVKDIIQAKEVRENITEGGGGGGGGVIITVGVGTVWFILLSVIILLYLEFKLLCIVGGLIGNGAGGPCERSALHADQQPFLSLQTTLIVFCSRVDIEGMRLHLFYRDPISIVIMGRI